MPSISDKKKEKITEQILYFLFSCSPDSRFTSDIAHELARDEEFIKSLLLNMQKKGLVTIITKNSDGSDYKRRQRWRLSNKAFAIYSSRQETRVHQSNISSNNEFE